MRICYISDERYPSPYADTLQVAKNVAALSRAGAQVELWVPRMWDTLQWSAQRRRDRFETYYKVSGGFALRELLSFPPAIRALVKVVHPVLVQSRLWLQGCDVVYTRNLLPLALALAAQKPVVFETYRPLTRQTLAFRLFFGAIAHRRHFMGIITHSNFTRESLVQDGVPPDRVVGICNGYEPSDMEPEVSKEEARRQLQLENRGLYLMFMGNLKPTDGFEALLALAERLPQTRLLLVGGASAEDVALVRATARRMHVKNVTVTGWQSQETVRLYLYSSDVLLLSPTAAPLKRHGTTVLPMKSFQYLAAGRPIVAPDLPDTAELLIHNRNCLRVKPDQPDQAAQGVQQVLDSQELAQRLGQQARQDAKQYTWEARGRKVLAFIQKRLETA